MAFSPAWAQRSGPQLPPQYRAGQAEEEENLLGLTRPEKRGQTPLEASLALDIPVDPTEYVLGPGDVLGLNLRGGIGMLYTATVSPEGNILVPQLPRVHVAGWTLAEVDDSLAVRWYEDLERVPVDVSLVSMRKMRVSVGGAVENPGQYVVTPADRALTLVDLAGGFTDEASDRHASITHRDSGSVRVDPLRFMRSGVLEANPRLRSGDHLIVEPKSEVDEQPRVQVGGGVRVPGAYEWVPGDQVMDLIELAGGLRDNADPDSVFLTGFVAGKPESRALSLNDPNFGRGPGIQPGDLVYVATQRRKNPSRAIISVRGEVARPGQYPVVANETRLLDLIEQAGGLTEDASLRGSRVWRLQPEDDFRAREVARLDTTDINALNRIDLQFLREYQQDLKRDLLPVNFVDLMHGDDDERDANNIYLSDSLVVSVPRRVHHVIVLGSVEQPGYYSHHDGWEYDDYIEEAGGYLKEADERQTRHMPYQSGQVVLARNDIAVHPGDIIFIPERYVPPFWSTFKDVFTVVFQAATLAVLIMTNT